MTIPVVLPAYQKQSFKQVWDHLNLGSKTLMTVTSSTKLIYFQRKYQESAQREEYAVHLLIRLGHLEIHIAVRQIRSDARILVQGHCLVIVTLSLL